MFTRVRTSGLVVAAALVLASGVASAEEIDPRDLVREVQARQALQKDPQLAPLNLGVRVRNRIATLTGPVPTRGLAQRAVDVLKKLPELSEVREQLLVQFEDGPVLPPAVALPKITQPTQSPAAAKDPPSTQPPLAWKPVVAPPGPEQEPLRPSVHLLPSLGPGMAGTVSRAKTADPPDAAAIGSAVQALVQGEDRFRRVRYEVKQSKVYLSGVVYRWSDLHELSLAVTHIPGVESVVLRDVRTEPRK
jgi:hypothetical protein